MQFSEFILANVRLYALRNDKSLSTHAVANFTRSELATALRKVGESRRLALCRSLTTGRAVHERRAGSLYVCTPPDV